MIISIMAVGIMTQRIIMTLRIKTFGIMTLKQ